MRILIAQAISTALLPLLVLTGCVETIPRSDPAPVISGGVEVPPPILPPRPDLQPRAGDTQPHADGGDTEGAELSRMPTLDTPRVPAPAPIVAPGVQPAAVAAPVVAPMTRPAPTPAPPPSPLILSNVDPASVPAGGMVGAEPDLRAMRPFSDQEPVVAPSPGIGTRTVSDDPNTRIAAYQSTTPSSQVPAYSRAVTTLLAVARNQEDKGEYGAAAEQLVRAVELEPRNASLWHSLARLRLAEGKFEDAESAARRSNELATGELALQRANWSLISEIRFELNDPAGGDAAARRAEELY